MKLILMTIMMLSLGLLTACGGSSGGSSGDGSDNGSGEPSPSIGDSGEAPKDPEEVNNLDSLPSTIDESVNEYTLVALNIPEYKATNSYVFTGVDADKVKLVGEAGEIVFNSSPAYDGQASYNFIIIVTNESQQTKDINVTISIVDVVSDLDSLASVITESANENSRFAFAIPEYKDTNSYAFTGVDGDSVKLWAERGEVIFNYAPDYETQASYNFIMTVTNEMEQAKDIDVTVNIDDVTHDFIFEVLAGTTGTLDLVINDNLEEMFNEFSFEIYKNGNLDRTITRSGNIEKETIVLKDRTGKLSETQRYTIKPTTPNGLPGIQIESEFNTVEMKVIQWGDNAWKSLESMITAICSEANALLFTEKVGAPNLVETTNMHTALQHCGSIEGIRYWDVSSVENMQAVFSGAEEFNSDLSQWDVSSVKNMSGMFDRALAFNSDISSWDTSSVENMEAMFYLTKSFDQDLRGWDVGSVTSYGWFNKGSILRDEYLPCFADTCVIPAQ